MTPTEAFRKMVELLKDYNSKYINVKPTHIDGYPIELIEKALEENEELKEQIKELEQVVYLLECDKNKFIVRNIALSNRNAEMVEEMQSMVSIEKVKALFPTIKEHNICGEEYEMIVIRKDELFKKLDELKGGDSNE